MAIEELTFFQSISVVDGLGLFGDASRTLFRVESLVSMVAVGQDKVLGSRYLSKERDNLKEKYETFERENPAVENELAELREKAGFV